MQGVLVVDKPQGVTSHDVVAVARRTLGESRIGHTGTLDPLATGVLPLALNRATRLIRFLSASDKDYRATIRFGFTTDSYDVTGTETSRTDRVPTRDEVTAAIESLTGEYLQEPPAFSAKKIAGRRAYDLARKSESVTLQPVPVRVARANLVDYQYGAAQVDLSCSAGFYVRSFAHALGRFTGTGACLEALRRTRSGTFSLDQALELASLGDAQRVAASLVPLDALLPDLPAVFLSERGRIHVTHGRDVGPEDFAEGPSLSPWVRLIDASGALIALANPGHAPGSLHPSVVLI